MRFLLAALLAVAAVAAASVSAASPWQSCGTSADHLSISSLTISPATLAEGQQFTVALSGSLNEQLTGGSVSLSVKFLGIQVYSATVDVCQLASQAGLSCPLPSGPVSISKSAIMPSAAPRGTYTGEIKVTDQNGEEVSCISFRMSVTGVSANSPVLDDALISSINGDPSSSWTAGRNARFEGMTIMDVKRMLRTRVSNPLSVVPVSTVEVDPRAVPASFDSHKEWPTAITPIRDQEQCGSCWAFSAAECLSDRFNIAEKAKKQIVLSPQYLVSCDADNYGCDGGYLDLTWQFLEQTGISTDACTPYTSGGGDSGTCPKKCKDGSAIKLYKAKNAKQLSSVAAIQQDLMTFGPVQAGFSVYQDFMNYKSGVYVHKSGGLLGGHAIRVEGWGSLNGKDYWAVANSWGTSWGMQGYFYIARGTNECGIESDVWSGQALVN